MQELKEQAIASIYSYTSLSSTVELISRRMILIRGGVRISSLSKHNIFVGIVHSKDTHSRDLDTFSVDIQGGLSLSQVNQTFLMSIASAPP
jgi:hypothetical protein